MEWIIVANASTARIYEALSRHSIKQIHNFEHRQSRMKAEQLVTDFPAHRRSPVYAGGSYTERSDPHHHEVEKFAVEIAKIIEQAHARSQFEQIVLIMPPEFLGIFLKHLSDTSKDSIRLSINKDYTKRDEQAIKEAVYPAFDTITI
jgi:protein required for attachment to host cells